MKENIKNEGKQNNELSDFNDFKRENERPPERAGARNRAAHTRPPVTAADYLTAGVPLWEAPPGELRKLASRIGNAALIELISKSSPGVSNLETADFDTAIFSRGWTRDTVYEENRITTAEPLVVLPPDFNGCAYSDSFAPGGLSDPGEAVLADE